MRKQIALLFTLLTFLGCRNQACEIDPEIAARQVDIPLDRLEKPFYQARSQGDIQMFLLKNQNFARHYLQTGQYPNQQATVSALWQLASEPNLKAFAGQVQQTFGDMADVNQELENAFRHLQHYYPAAPVPQVKTFISGMLGPDLYVSDSLVVLSWGRAALNSVRRLNGV